MSTEYSSKESALFTGMFYAGRSDLYTKDGKERSLDEIIKSGDVKVIEATISQFGYVHEDSITIEFTNSKGKPSRIASTKFRSGFDLWLIHPDSGMAIRT